MSYQLGSACYSTVVAAAQAQASSVAGSLVSHGSSAYVASAGVSESGAITYTLTPFGGGVPLVLSTPYTPQPCNLLQWSDGVSLGWSVGLVWIVVCAVLFLAKALPKEPDDGNS